MTGHLAQNKERHADRFTRFKYRWERLTPLCFLRRDERTESVVSFHYARRGTFGRKRAITRKIVGWKSFVPDFIRSSWNCKISRLFFFFSFFSRLGKKSFLEEKNLKCREKIGATFDQLVSLLRSKFENLEILKGKSDYERNWKILCARFYLFIVKVFQSLFF